MKRRVELVVFMAIALAVGCGTLADAGREPKGDSNLPSAGVAPWDKVDQDGDPKNLIQPFVLEASKAGERLDEPALVQVGDAVALFYERSGSTPEPGIWRTEASALDDLLHAGSGGRVLEAGLAWEGGRVGAPSVLVEDTSHAEERFRLWYAGGQGAGIGLATSPDGVHWARRKKPVLVPDQAWEVGSIGSPTVLRAGKELFLWYEGGAGAGIGFARSSDGITWVKEDATGRTSSSPGEGTVEPVLTSAEPWEGGLSRPFDHGRVGCPNVLLDEDERTPSFRLYYTGYLPIEESVLGREEVSGITPGELNRSIGFAASSNGLDWYRADVTINPIVAEKTPVQLGTVPFPPELVASLPDAVVTLLVSLFGSDEMGNPKVPALETVIDEGAATVVTVGPDRFALLFAQGNSFFVPLDVDLPAGPVSAPGGLLLRNVHSGLALALSRG